MDSKEALVVFEDKKVIRTWNNDEWWFVLEDIVYILTDSSDQYIQKMKQRDEPLSKGWVQIVHTLALSTSGGKQKMNCVNTEGAFRIIQSIMSLNQLTQELTERLTQDYLYRLKYRTDPILKIIPGKTISKHKTKAHLANLQEQQPDKTCK